MRRVREKLQSERGASILLALLFFTACTMVTLSILMAAVSNAGKIQSNKEEHQKYLALSSAMELLCDDLVNAEYTGRYSYSVTPQDPAATMTDAPAGKEIKTCTQLPGEYTSELVPLLRAELDTLFADQIQKDAAEKTIEADERYLYEYQLLPGNLAAEHTIAVDISDADAVRDYPELSSYQVTVVLKLNRQYSIHLAASLDGVEDYVLEAEVTPAENAASIGDVSVGEHATLPMKWELGWITKNLPGA